MYSVCVCVCFGVHTQEPEQCNIISKNGSIRSRQERLHSQRSHQQKACVRSCVCVWVFVSSVARTIVRRRRNIHTHTQSAYRFFLQFSHMNGAHIHTHTRAVEHVELSFGRSKRVPVHTRTRPPSPPLANNNTRALCVTFQGGPSLTSEVARRHTRRFAVGC